ncbi:hypothetical protein [Tabrizicola sp.]|uniref:hypothetical protein n=1 Tax=Tabrizicola sp. TaxID=2005166 RepID=UPI0025E5820E|nr:hypothetical protein [Tabrizicola sp.]MBY0352670.1 hypothetical protein [Tabrizicola sp.]
MVSEVATGEAVSLYLGLKPNEQVDLEVAATAAIEWARAIKAAANAAEPGYTYRVRLIAAKPGSNKWLAKVERSKINQAVKDMQEGYEQLPLVLRHAVAAAAVVIITGIPTYDYYFGDDRFTPEQVEQIEDAFRKAIADPEVQAHRKAMYKEVQKDPNITGVGGGVPDKDDWQPPEMIPATRFAEGDGLFELLDSDEEKKEDTSYVELDVILVTPQLVNAKRAWTFRQEGIPGKFSATMADLDFLSALDNSGIREPLRNNIPMRIRMEIKQELVGGEWRVKRRGRSVVRVLSPVPDPSALSGRNATQQP